MKLVIAEKPMLARDIARAICGKDVTEKARLPISGNGYTVIGCAGHLLELVEPETLDERWGKPWKMEALPVSWQNWPKRPTADKKDLVDTIANLLNEADSVIHAGDPDDEGQLIVDELLDYLGYNGAARTQDITQALRDKYKAITYNRSDSQYLKTEHHDQAKDVLAQAMRNLGVDWQLDYTIKSKAFNDKNVTAHHGIIPQEADAPVTQMSKDEARVYKAIVERYAMQFLPPAVYDVSTSEFDDEDGTFQAVTKRLKTAGWLATFGNATEDDEDDTSSNGWIDAGGHTLTSTSCQIIEKQTTPPKPYTEGSLITDMASIAKYVTNPDIKTILKKKDDGKKGEHGGIGTTATRATIIEKLKARGYLVETKGKLRSTAKAREFYHVVPPEIRGADVTATWWLIQHGTLHVDRYTGNLNLADKIQAAITERGLDYLA